MVLCGNKSSILHLLIELPRQVVDLWISMLDCEIFDDGPAAVDGFLLVLEAHLADALRQSVDMPCLEL